MRWRSAGKPCCRARSRRAAHARTASARTACLPVLVEATVDWRCQGGCRPFLRACLLSAMKSVDAQEDRFRAVLPLGDGIGFRCAGGARADAVNPVTAQSLIPSGPREGTVGDTV